MNTLYKLAIGFTALAAVGLTGCSSSNVDELKTVAPDVWAKQGFETVAYEGYKFGPGGIPPLSEYGGAKVWNRLKKVPDNGVTYSGSIQKWGNEYHVYGPEAIDAFRPK